MFDWGGVVGGVGLLGTKNDMSPKRRPRWQKNGGAIMQTVQSKSFAFGHCCAIMLINIWPWNKIYCRKPFFCTTLNLWSTHVFIIKINSFFLCSVIVIHIMCSMKQFIDSNENYFVSNFVWEIIFLIQFDILVPNYSKGGYFFGKWNKF